MAANTVLELLTVRKHRGDSYPFIYCLLAFLTKNLINFDNEETKHPYLIEFYHLFLLVRHKLRKHL